MFQPRYIQASPLLLRRSIFKLERSRDPRRLVYSNDSNGCVAISCDRDGCMALGLRGRNVQRTPPSTRIARKSRPRVLRGAVAVDLYRVPSTLRTARSVPGLGRASVSPFGLNTRCLCRGHRNRPTAGGPLESELRHWPILARPLRLSPRSVTGVLESSLARESRHEIRFVVLSLEPFHGSTPCEPHQASSLALGAHSCIPRGGFSLLGERRIRGGRRSLRGSPR